MKASEVRVLVGLAVGCLLLGLLGVAVVASDTPDPAPRVPGPAPRPKRVVHAARSGERVSLPRPPADPARPAPRTHLDPETKLEMNTTVDDVVRVARTDCLEPWVAGLPDAPTTEVVLDVVTVDGDVSDLGFRSLGADLPADVVMCVADAVWANEWPHFSDLEGKGETRMQRSFSVEAPK